MAQVYYSIVCQLVKGNRQWQSLWRYSPSGMTMYRPSSQPRTRALIRVVGESSRASMGRSVLTTSSLDSRALIGSSTGLAERETSNCGTVSLRPLVGDGDIGGVTSLTSESRLRGSFCRKPSSLPTLSILLKYFVLLARTSEKKDHSVP
jgi:hypothetical protein